MRGGQLRAVQSSHELERFASLATGTALVAMGVRRRPMSALYLAAAAPLMYRGIVGEWPIPHSSADTKAALGGARGVNVRESIRLEKPIDEVYQFWRQVENLPRFMTHLSSVTAIDDRRSRWVAEGPAGVPVEWEAEIFNEIPNRLIAWRSLEGSDITTAGSVNFTTVRGGRNTQVSVNLQYEPPAGRPGAWVAKMFGREPSQTIREDLRHLKQLLEAGEIPRATPDAKEW
jgi:uncharacterized membrane protein